MTLDGLLGREAPLAEMQVTCADQPGTVCMDGNAQTTSSYHLTAPLGEVRDKSLSKPDEAMDDSEEDELKEEPMLNTLTPREINQGECKSALQDERMKDYIQWYKNGNSYGFSIPNINTFQQNVLTKYFQDINQWGSFLKQLSNYGFKKIGRASLSRNQACYMHKAGMLRPGHPELLPQVRKPEERVPIPPPDVLTAQQSITSAFNLACSSPGAFGSDVLSSLLLKLQDTMSELKTRVQALETRIVGLESGHNQLKAKNRELQARLELTEKEVRVIEARPKGSKKRKLAESLAELPRTQVQPDPRPNPEAPDSNFTSENTGRSGYFGDEMGLPARLA
ncbi:hypothetical protein FRB90_001281, partial [Tulasnella sp. 427]